jgi:predicted nucleic acid-binding protein
MPKTFLTTQRWKSRPITTRMQSTDIAQRSYQTLSYSYIDALLHPAPLSGMSPDPKDDKFMACALAARADFLVTGNKRDFPLDQLGATKVVSAGELLNLITLEL